MALQRTVGNRAVTGLIAGQKRSEKQTTHNKANKTGIPDDLKAGAEALSGLDLSDVRVHRNSTKPSALQALAYTRLPDIHIAAGQERHLPHEVWHAVQQKKGRVKPTGSVAGMPLNDSLTLEMEADSMGRKALLMNVDAEVPVAGQPRTGTHRLRGGNTPKAVQRARVAGNPQRIAEEEYVIVESGNTIEFTDLAAGCLTVAVEFKEGGGAGVHMAMQEQGSGQWRDFYAAIGGKTATKAYANCDGWGSYQDWRVNEKASAPMAPLKLVDESGWTKLPNEDKEQDALYQEGWVYETAAVLDWFKNKLGVWPKKGGGGSPEFTFP